MRKQKRKKDEEQKGNSSAKGKEISDKTQIFSFSIMTHDKQKSVKFKIDFDL